MLFLGKDCNHSLALPLKEKGKILSLTISPYNSLYFWISQSSTKLFKCKLLGYGAENTNFSYLQYPNPRSMLWRCNVTEGIGVHTFEDQIGRASCRERV